MSDSWINLKHFTQARIALGRCGHSQPTKAHLDFQIAHARARDAVHIYWDLDLFAKNLEKETGIQTLKLESQVEDRSQYLKRPDLGRKLKTTSLKIIENLVSSNKNPYDIAIIVTNGLSSPALQSHGIPFLKELVNNLGAKNFKISPLCLLANGRVAISDEIGQLLKAKISIIIVGERPGLSVPDSLGIYLTYHPQIGKTDADRNCISNIHEPQGLAYTDACEKVVYLSEEALRKGLSGVHLKDEMISSKPRPLID